jgi:hypothetical protein
MNARLVFTALPPPRILISIDASRVSQPFSTHHSPSLPPGAPEIGVSTDRLSLETLLKDCVKVRSHSILKSIKKVLKGTIWDEDGTFRWWWEEREEGRVEGGKGKGQEKGWSEGGRWGREEMGKGVGGGRERVVKEVGP